MCARNCKSVVQLVVVDTVESILLWEARIYD